jgi:uncharacterized phage infection (PIP) family protein YhgE
MTEQHAVQVSAKQEDTQVAFIQSVVAFLQDATNLPKLRQEVEGLRAEAEILKKGIQDLQAEVDLEREAHAKTLDEKRTSVNLCNSLQAKLSSLQHKFDTINGVVMAAMAEIERDKPKPVIEIVKEEPKPWTPSSPISSVGF